MALPPISPSGVNSAFLYGTQVTSGPGIVPVINADPGNVNPPIIFEPPSLLTSCQLAIWIIVTGTLPNWGGCQVWVSGDDTTYGFLGAAGSGMTQGVLTAPFPAGSDPDTADTLSVDLTESSGTLISATDHDADLGLTLAYVGNGGADFELVSYSAANLTSLNNYDLDTYLRRGFYGTPIGSWSSGANFGLALSAFIHDFPTILVGETIYFKFLSFNSIGSQPQDLASVSSYPYTITGAGSCTGIKCRTVTAGATATLSLSTDYLLTIAKTVGSATTVNGPALPVPDGTRFEIADAGNGGFGDSDYNPITFVPAGGVLVNGDVNYILQSRGGKMTVTYCASLGQWTASTQI